MLDIIRQRIERNILIVSHGVFLETLLNRCSLACVDEGLRARRFENAEMRSIVVGGWGSIVYPPQLVQPAKGALAQICTENGNNNNSSSSNNDNVMSGSENNPQSLSASITQSYSNNNGTTNTNK